LQAKRLYAAKKKLPFQPPRGEKREAERCDVGLEHLGEKRQ